jgi:4-hydroxy-3-methylbut-2-enyl diphosphate reductase
VERYLKIAFFCRLNSKMMIVNIDQGAGFCSGVRRAIRLAEKELEAGNQLFCLGQIVHNEAEVARLESMGMETINRAQLRNLQNCTVLIRAHGEPPETYSIAEENNIRIIDGTCPTVLRLQAKVKNCFNRQKDAQIAIFGKQNHPEVIGLNGQTNFTAVILEKPEDIEQLDFSRPVCLFAQTTQNENEYHQIVRAIKAQKIKILANEALHFTATESICKQVSRRESSLKAFARENDVVLFAGGDHSSNGKYLYALCRRENPSTYYISGTGIIDPEWFANAHSVGVTGATSTPQWLLEELSDKVRELFQYKTL